MENVRTRKIRISTEEYMTKINDIRDTVNSLEESLMISRNLEAEHWLRYSILKINNKGVRDDLKKANKHNKNMLNLFRQSVTDIRLGSAISLPDSLQREVQRTWHQKYDALLAQNEELKKEISGVNILLIEKKKETDGLQQKLLNLGDRLVERNEAVENICKKYLTLKKRKDEQEILLRGSIETLQGALKTSNNVSARTTPRVSLIPNKNAMLAREIRRSQHLSTENSLLRALLQDTKRDSQIGRKSSKNRSKNII